MFHQSFFGTQGEVEGAAEEARLKTVLRAKETELSIVHMSRGGGRWLFRAAMKSCAESFESLGGCSAGVGAGLASCTNDLIVSWSEDE